MLEIKENLKLTGAVDIVFKAIMYKHPKVFKKILELSLNKKIEKFTYLSPELPVRQFIEKGRRLDVYLVTEDSYVDVEVSSNYKKSIKNRNLAYGYQMYCETVQKGDDYEDYKKIELINFIFDKNNEKGILNSYLKDQYGNITSNMLLYSEIYIEKFKQLYYNKEEEQIRKYKYYIMLSLTIEELEKFNEEYGDEIVEEYKESLEEISSIEEFKPLFSKEEDERRMWNTYRKWERREALEEGQKNKQIEIAKNMFKKKMNIHDIIEITGLSQAEIINLNIDDEH